MRGVAAYLRSLDPQLPRDVWVLQIGGLVNAFGNGIMLPFLIIYLHNVRGIPLGIAGLSAAANSLAAFGSGFLAGSLGDRIGPRRVLIAALAVMAGVICLFPLIREGWHAIALNAALGSASGSFWPSQSSLLTRLAPADRRAGAFATQRLTMNLGDALVLLGMPDPGTHAGDNRGTYLDVVRDRVFMAVVVLNAVFMASSMAVWVELLPPFAKNQAHVSERGVGALWLVESLAVVVAQLPVARLAEGRRRMRALALMGAVWAATEVGFGAAGYWTKGALAGLLMALLTIPFAAGECLHGTVHAPLSADLAPPRLVGRYMAFASQSWQIGWIIGPAGGGFVLQHHPYALWPLVAGINLAASAVALALERALPRGVRLTPASAEAAPGLAKGP